MQKVTPNLCGGNTFYAETPLMNKKDRGRQICVDWEKEQSTMGYTASVKSNKKWMHA